MGVLVLQEGEGDDDASLRYRLPAAYGTVLADPSSDEYDIAMVQLVPSLLQVGRLFGRLFLVGFFRSCW